MSGKVFGIGLSKTGTTSLCAALRRLGLTTADYHEHYREGRGVGTWFSGDFSTDCLIGYDAAVDTPIPAYFEQLDHRYPDSKFILTVRDIESWITSARNYFQRWSLNNEFRYHYGRTARLIVFGVDEFEEGRFRSVYARHLRDVMHYFRDRPDDLVTLNIEAGDGWDVLCPFLERSIPQGSFPWANQYKHPAAEPNRTTVVGFPHETKRVVAIAANFAAEPIEESLAFWCHSLEIPIELKLAFQDHLIQQLLDRESLFGRNSTGINVILLRLEMPSHPPDSGHNVGPAKPNSDLLFELTHAVPLAAESGTPLYVVLCPSGGNHDTSAQNSETLDQAASRLRVAFGDQPAINVFSYTQIAADFAPFNVVGEAGERRFNIPYSTEFYTLVGTFLARQIHSRFASGSKVIVVDCDETLWHGVSGEDGVAGITIASEHRAFQRRLVDQYNAGMLICLCSKNRSEDVFDVFDGHPDMILSREHLAATRINWEPKSANLRSLSNELELGLDSFIFLDDDPVVCAEVEANAPEVLTLRFPRQASDIEPFVDRIWAFDRPLADPADTLRNERYRDSRERTRVEQESTSLKEFHERLNLDVQISELTREHVPRVSQLSFRTNQFNFTSVRRSAAEIEQLRGLAESTCLTVHARDRFGDYGLIGFAIVVEQANAIAVDTFLLSCRALGRGIEHRMVAKLGELASAKGLPAVDFRFVPTDRNKPALLFLSGIANANAGALRNGEEHFFRIPSDAASAVMFDVERDSSPVKADVNGPIGQSDSPLLGSTARTKRLARIPYQFAEIPQILAAIRAEKSRSRSSVDLPYVAPQTDIEESLATIWAHVLDVDRVGREDNFFLLGGHSLAMIKILSRTRDLFGVEPTFEPFFADPCVRAAAAEIEQLLIDGPPD